LALYKSLTYLLTYLLKDNCTVNIVGADVNKVGPGGSSPLAEAARIGSAKMVEFLVDQGADVELKNPAYSGATAVVVAVINRRRTVVDVLIAVSSVYAVITLLTLLFVCLAPARYPFNGFFVL